MFFTLLYLMGVTVSMALFPEWSTATALLVPLAVVAVLKTALHLWPHKTKPPKA